MIALLASETLQVVDVVAGPHYHLERRDHLGASGAVPGTTEQPMIHTHMCEEKKR